VLDDEKYGDTDEEWYELMDGREEIDKRD